MLNLSSRDRWTTSDKFPRPVYVCRCTAYRHAEVLHMSCLHKIDDISTIYFEKNLLFNIPLHLHTSTLLAQLRSLTLFMFPQITSSRAPYTPGMEGNASVNSVMSSRHRSLLVAATMVRAAHIQHQLSSMVTAQSWGCILHVIVETFVDHLGLDTSYTCTATVQQ